MIRCNLFVLTLSAVVLSACSNDKGKDGAGDRTVKVGTVLVEDVSARSGNSYSGTVEEETGTQLSFAVPGTVSRVLVDEGDRVSKGQLIATLDPAQLRNAYALAKTGLDQATDAYNRMKELHSKGSLPEIKWVDAQSALERARSTEQMAAKQLSDCRVYAPFSGVISKKLVERGQNVAAGMPVAKLVSVGRLKVKIAVPEGDIPDVSLGQRAVVSVTALGGNLLEGTVVEKGVDADPLSRSYDVKIGISNGGGHLMPGMVATVDMAGKTGSQACVIPAHIVQIDENNNEFVWLAVNGKATKRIITCGDFTVGGVVVSSGLEPGDRIITSGQQKVSEGMKVKF